MKTEIEKIEPLENNKPDYHGQLGGARVGAGRKKGGFNASTKLRIDAMKGYRERACKATDKLFNAQIANALGNVYLYRIDETTDDKGKSIKKHVLVEDPDEIKDVLDENEGCDGVVDDNYYYITTKKPDNNAIDSILDRTYGKAASSLDIKITDPIEFLSLKTESALSKLFSNKE